MSELTRRHIGRLALVALFAGPTFAQSTFPSKAVNFVVPVTTGGGTDLVARQLAKSLADQWRQPVVVENKPGASGIIGSTAVAKRAPDGYNLLVAYDGAIVAAPVLVNRPDYTPLTQLSPISQVSLQGYALVVHPSVPVNNVAELIQHIKKKNAEKAPFGFATGSPGTADHLSGETFQRMAGVELLTVHYKGTAPAIADVLGGHIPFGIFSFTGALPHIKSGALRALAVTSEKRSALLPELPTVGETVRGFQYQSWIGVFGPAGMPEALRARIARDIETAVNSYEMATVLMSNGLVPVASTPSAFSEFVGLEAVRTAEVIKLANIKVQQ